MKCRPILLTLGAALVALGLSFFLWTRPVHLKKTLGQVVGDSSKFMFVPTEAGEYVVSIEGVEARNDRLRDMSVQVAVAGAKVSNAKLSYYGKGLEVGKTTLQPEIAYDITLTIGSSFKTEVVTCTIDFSDHEYENRFWRRATNALIAAFFVLIGGACIFTGHIYRGSASSTPAS